MYVRGFIITRSGVIARGYGFVLAFCGAVYKIHHGAILSEVPRDSAYTKATVLLRSSISLSLHSE